MYEELIGQVVDRNRPEMSTFPRTIEGQVFEGYSPETNTWLSSPFMSFEETKAAALVKLETVYQRRRGVETVEKFNRTFRASAEEMVLLDLQIRAAIIREEENIVVNDADNAVLVGTIQQAQQLLLKMVDAQKDLLVYKRSLRQQVENAADVSGIPAVLR